MYEDLEYNIEFTKRFIENSNKSESCINELEKYINEAELINSERKNYDGKFYNKSVKY